jgi:beta-N-acetylhexosaminidase
MNALNARTPRTPRAPRLVAGLLLVTGAGLAAGCAAHGGGAAPVAAPPASAPALAPAGSPAYLEAERWARGTLAGLSLEEKVGQLLMTRRMGDFENVNSPSFQAFVREIQELGIGGVAVSIGSPPEIAAKLNALQRASKLPLLIGADLEYGPGMRLWTPVFLPYVMEGGAGTILPYNMGLGAIGDPAAAEAAGRLTAAEARAVGINWIFAPVLDVNTNPINPIVNVRSYGSDPELVGRLGAAFVRGAEAGGVLTAAKHFPGHGDAGVDSHVDLPVLESARERILAVDVAPFAAIVRAGATGIMTGHLAFPALAGDRHTPSSVSSIIVNDLLRRDLGFQGLIVTDALTMGALRRLPGYTPGELAVRAFEAGSDVLLSTPSYRQAHAALVAAVRSGRISEARVDSSVARILTAKGRLGLHRQRTVELDRVNEVVSSPEHERLATELAERSIVLARDEQRLIPLDPQRVGSVAAISFSAPNELLAGRALAAELRRIYGTAPDARIHNQSAPAEVDAAVARAAAADAIVFAAFLSPLAGQGHLHLPEAGRGLFERLVATGRPVIVVSFGDPYGGASLTAAGTYLLAWQPRGPHAQRAAARALAGEREISGRLPVELPGHPFGSGLRRAPLQPPLALAEPADVGLDAAGLARVDSLLAAAVADGAAPGAALAIGRHGRLVRLQGYGRLDPRPGFAAAADSTIWDLASLTKVVATTTAAMLMVEDEKLELDAPVARYMPAFRGEGKHAVTVRQLLAHTSGLPSFAPLWRDAQGRDEVLRRILETPLAHEPGSRVLYSDFGMILLARIVEQVAGVPLDELLQERVFGPLGMRETGFNPLAWTAEGGHPLLARIAPTEVDTLYRHAHVHGVVHDENAHASGGVSGHAGLFSSARDLAIFAQLLLNGGSYAGVRVLQPETIERFTARQPAAGSRALGWDTPTPTSSAGQFFSARAFGHTGFTGTSLWIDPEQDLFVVLLTNRVNPTRANQRHVPLRRAVHDAVQQAIVERSPDRAGVEL